LGGHFAWKELLKITKKGDLDKYFGDKIDKLKSNQKEDLKSLEDEYEMVKNMIDDL